MGLWNSRETATSTGASSDGLLYATFKTFPVHLDADALVIPITYPHASAASSVNLFGKKNGQATLWTTDGTPTKCRRRETTPYVSWSLCSSMHGAGFKHISTPLPAEVRTGDSAR